ncbi:hypothetical protein GGX14DRAFT_403446 [Mycena pura]|uniref:Uncharacterized protein n=1 Tax=Mycena pura TaxID=153505 RepID=A0AAD6UW06_9AGAR|nr:hypothetical protein GGX14DRAFT_403446 [Mycena pura]
MCGLTNTGNPLRKPSPSRESRFAQGQPVFKPKMSLSSSTSSFPPSSEPMSYMSSSSDAEMLSPRMMRRPVENLSTSRLNCLCLQADAAFSGRGARRWIGDDSAAERRERQRKQSGHQRGNAAAPLAGPKTASCRMARIGVASALRGTQSHWQNGSRVARWPAEKPVPASTGTGTGPTSAGTRWRPVPITSRSSELDSAE